MGDAIRVPSEAWHARVRYSTVKSTVFAEEDHRLDANTYAQAAFEALQILKNHKLGAVPFSSLAGKIFHPTENQPRSNFKRVWVAEGEGVPFLTGRQLSFFRPIADKFVSRRMQKLDELMLPQGTILLSRSGSTGNPTLVGQRLARFAITDDALRVTPGKAPTGFLYAFLSTSFAQALITKAEYGKVVVHIEAPHIGALPVPRLPKELVNAVDEKILRAVEMRDAANKMLDAADAELHKVLGVAPFSERDIEFMSAGRARAFSSSSHAMSDRLDATNYLPTARSAVHKLERGRYRLGSLASAVGDAAIYVAPRFARIYVEEHYGIPLLQGSQLPQVRPYDLKYISTTKTERIERWVIKERWVLVTCSGTIGRVSVCTRKQAGWAASQHILRVMCPEESMHPGFLAAFLATPFGQHQMTSKIYGGIVDELTAEDMGALVVPMVPGKEQRRIGEQVLRAYEVRDQANDIEAEAISDLELAIEGQARVEDRRDIAIAERRLDEIAASPTSLLSGAALEERLKLWQS